MMVESSVATTAAWQFEQLLTWGCGKGGGAP
jgi:hypothetical protein